VNIPNWYELALLALAAFRVWKLLSEDLILEGPREAMLTHFPSVKLIDFLECPWCLGAHVSLLWWIAYEIWPHWTVVVAVPWAISALVGLIAKAASE